MTEKHFDICVETHGRVLVDARDVSVAEGGMTFLFGESGIGKSLVGKTLAGLIDEAELRCTVNAESYGRYSARPEVRERRHNGFFVFQEPSSHFNPLQTLDEQIREGMLAAVKNPAGVVGELWSDAGRSSLPGILSVYPKPYRPSGGEKQRILAGMAFSKMDVLAGTEGAGEGLFVFDEPTGSLDREARNRFLDRLFDRFRRRHDTILLITHDYGMISYIQRSHRDLLPLMHFSELVLKGKVTRGRTFAPERFLQWLHARTPFSVPGRAEVLLRVESGIRVIGKTLRFRTGGGAGEELPLLARRGDLVYIKAGSGVGKTTVAKVVIGLQRAERFRMEFEGVGLDERSPHQYWERTLWGKRMTMAFQHADESLNPNASVEETLGLLPIPAMRSRVGILAALGSLFDEDEIPRLRERKVWQLSGGQKQRLNLLRACSLSTPLIILDEPLSALDFESIDRVLLLMEQARSRGQTIVLISHNEDIFDAVVPEGCVYYLEGDA
jgi:peptide/nickel transport system ATP-binding protein